MKEAKKDLFASIHDPDTNVDAICITTNGHWTLDGKAVMGGGCARVCADNWPETCINLGGLLKKNFGTNIPYLIGAVNNKGFYKDPSFAVSINRKDEWRKRDCLIFSFPTIDNLIDGADLELIQRSCVIMMQYADLLGLQHILLPRPGAGTGGLTWKDVKGIIEPILDDRFTIVSFEHEE